MLVIFSNERSPDGARIEGNQHKKGSKSPVYRHSVETKAIEEISS
jgi:hypothetical protein